MKKAGLTNGYIQFIFVGSQESKKGVFAATQDENTVMFTKKEQPKAEEIKKYVENFLAIRRNCKVKRFKRKRYSYRRRIPSKEKATTRALITRRGR